MFDINAILQKADLVTMVERAGGNLKQRGGGYSCACVLHGGDNPTALSIYQKDGKWLWNCFTGSCGGGDAIDFVQKWQGLEFKAACEFISGEKIADPQAMKESAESRLEAARIERIAAQEREAARRHELRTAEKHLLYHNNMLTNAWMRAAWNECGIDDGMQDFWSLGGCNNFSVDGQYTTPTLTIPIFNEQSELMTIRHRLIKPENPKDKYRPDTAGLHSHPFLAFPVMGYDGGIIWVMEGEKKAMVTWTHANTDWQCIGVPGQAMYNHLVNELRPVGQRVVVVPDPGAEEKAVALAREIGGKVLQVPMKIDDYILLAKIGKDDLYRMQKQAVRA
jgi:hypothetical protein